MKKLILIVLLLISMNPVMASSMLYIGEDQGSLFAGIKAGVNINGIDIEYDIKSTGLTTNKIGTYAPNRVIYQVSVSDNDKSIFYRCKHAVDEDVNLDYTYQIGISYVFSYLYEQEEK